MLHNEIASWDPFEDLFRPDGLLGRLLQPGRFPAEGSSERAWSFPLDIFESDGAWHITAVLPGIKPEDIEVNAHDGLLTIEGQVQEEQDQDRPGRFHLREFRSGTYSRCIRLPDNVDVDAASASYENGILTLELPMAEAARPKRIEVHA